MIGLLGVGLLGSAIGDRLTAAGRPWIGYDPRRMDLAASREEVLEKSTTLILCLPDSNYTARALEGIEGPRTIIDATTGDPAEMKKFAADLKPKGIHYLDVTIGGSSAVFRAGAGILMAGAEKGDFEANLPLLKCLSEKIFLCGPPGSGALMKLVFNLVLGLNRAALAEGLAFAERSGLPLRQTLEVLQAGPAASRIMERKGPKMVSQEYVPEARLSQHHKDVRLILSEAARHNLHLPLSEAHKVVLAASETLGLGELDNSALIEAYRNDSVVKP